MTRRYTLSLGTHAQPRRQSGQASDPLRLEQLNSSAHRHYGLPAQACILHDNRTGCLLGRVVGPLKIFEGDHEIGPPRANSVTGDWKRDGALFTGRCIYQVPEAQSNSLACRGTRHLAPLLASANSHHAFHFGPFRSCSFRPWVFWRLTLPELWKVASSLKHVFLKSSLSF
jgi:hypothetical protein